MLAVELAATLARPELGVTITQDRESNATAVVSERISQYTAEVNAVLHISRIRLGRRARPYVMGGAGYVRQLHEDRLLAEMGRTMHAGGGVRYWLAGGSAKTRALGLRAEARVVRRTGAIDFADKSRNYAAFSLLGFVGL